MTKRRKRGVRRLVPDSAPPDERTFRELMHQAGVKPLDPTDTGHPAGTSGMSTVLISENRPVRFEPVSTFEPIVEPVLPAAKYQGAPKPSPLPSTRRIRVNRRFEPEMMLDLHGETRDSALRKTAQALNGARRNNQRSILIITGKGIHSGRQGAILNRAVRQWLENRTNACPMRLQEAPPHLGGSGAILVLLYPANQ
jgi:DNA-nicking Smr family endonuclease